MSFLFISLTTLISAACSAFNSLIEDPNEPSITDLAEAKKYLKDCCYVQFQIIDDLLERGQVEGLLSFLLNVRYLYEEH